MTKNTPITVAYGDGIGPEIMEATLKILKESGAAIHIETIEVGKRVYERGNSTGIPSDAWDSIHRTKILLKAPITTPQGGGYKSLNVTLRKTLGLYANVRPCASYAPYVPTNHPTLDLVIVRENEEDLYSGIEHRQTENTYQCLKLITKSGSERIMRYAFEYAMRNNRKKVACFSKDNIMKMTDGVFHRAFDSVAKDYPSIATEHYIVDIAAARLAAKPQIFDVIVTENLYGDIVSDIAAEISGSVGLAGSSNIGVDYAMFEAIHGSAPDIAGKNIANPSGLLNAAIMLLVHIGQGKTAALIHNAWLVTLEKGEHTGDIYSSERSTVKLGTQEFADAVISHFGEMPSHFAPVSYPDGEPVRMETSAAQVTATAQIKELIGVDVFLDTSYLPVEEIVVKLKAANVNELPLHTLSSKGLKIWPKPMSEPAPTDHVCCRFMSNGKVAYGAVMHLLGELHGVGLDVVKTENLYTFDGASGFTLGQGE